MYLCETLQPMQGANVSQCAFRNKIVTGFDKIWHPHTQWQGKLTIHVCIIVIVSLVCFSWGLFLGPVWCA